MPCFGTQPVVCRPEHLAGQVALLLSLHLFPTLLWIIRDLGAVLQLDVLACHWELGAEGGVFTFFSNQDHSWGGLGSHFDSWILGYFKTLQDSYLEGTAILDGGDGGTLPILALIALKREAEGFCVLISPFVSFLFIPSDSLPFLSTLAGLKLMTFLLSLFPSFLKLLTIKEKSMVFLLSMLRVIEENHILRFFSRRLCYKVIVNHWPLHNGLLFLFTLLCKVSK